MASRSIIIGLTALVSEVRAYRAGWTWRKCSSVTPLDVGAVTPTETILERVRFVGRSRQLDPAGSSRRVAFGGRCAILRNAIALDPHAIRKLVRPALTVVQLKVAKELRVARQRFASRASQIAKFDNSVRGAPVENSQEGTRSERLVAVVTPIVHLPLSAEERFPAPLAGTPWPV